MAKTTRQIGDYIDVRKTGLDGWDKFIADAKEAGYRLGDVLEQHDIVNIYGDTGKDLSMVEGWYWNRGEALRVSWMDRDVTHEYTANSKQPLTISLTHNAMANTGPVREVTQQCQDILKALYDEDCLDQPWYDVDNGDGSIDTEKVVIAETIRHIVFEFVMCNHDTFQSSKEKAEIRREIVEQNDVLAEWVKGYMIPSRAKLFMECYDTLKETYAIEDFTGGDITLNDLYDIIEDMEDFEIALRSSGITVIDDVMEKYVEVDTLQGAYEMAKARQEYMAFFDC